MRLYAGIDLHANNSYMAVIDETDELVFGKRYRNDLGLICKALEPDAAAQLSSARLDYGGCREPRRGDCGRLPGAGSAVLHVSSRVACSTYETSLTLSQQDI